MPRSLARENPERSDIPFDVVVLATSLGGLSAIRTILSALPKELPVPVVFVLHRTPTVRIDLATILQRNCLLRVEEPANGERLVPGVVYAAPADRHLTLDSGGCTRLSREPRVNFVRPAADLLFTSAAEVYGPRTLAIVLTGRGEDGAAGATKVQLAGGMVLVQDKATSRAFSMPRATIATGCADLVLPLEAVASAIIALIMAPGAVVLFGGRRGLRPQAA